MKEVVFNILKKALKELKVKISAIELWNVISVPPTTDMGDFAFPCFFLSETLKEDPHEIALRIRETIGEPNATDFEDIQVSGPYVNFILNRKSMAREVVWGAITWKKKY